MTKIERLTQREFQRGFSLIEVLVALVILVIGLIGIFNLHIVAKRGSFESFQQTQASYYANDMINRIKLNRTEMSKYHDTYSSVTSSPSPSCQGANLCTPSQLVLADKYEWKQAIFGESEKIEDKAVGGLDTPTGCVVVAGNVVTVTLAWKGISSTSDAGGDCGTASTRRRVYSIQTVIM
ncbi:MAG: type IV pilus modification protein PilV [Shewanella sp.]|jgi:type IV pilus assembly protein PilV|uniref:type IV pilus modification protein PilV n=1 Tax=unclassified Shewanella TaxID=196818 RepID=UPI0021D86191|nr:MULTISPECIES: type IV pilus modification protein PilV [unclassified Shewanella]MCU8032559.1 type IV pilus modification protein PilV [Shewanella sp. SM71]MCU8094445.1 type IV pilus modification protein PilV [Shewanella sp. SM102]